MSTESIIPSNDVVPTQARRRTPSEQPIENPQPKSKRRAPALLAPIRKWCRAQRYGFTNSEFHAAWWGPGGGGRSQALSRVWNILAESHEIMPDVPGVIWSHGITLTGRPMTRPVRCVGGYTVDQPVFIYIEKRRRAQLARADEALAKDRGRDIHERIAEGFNWPVEHARSFALPALQDLLRSTSPKLATEVGRIVSHQGAHAEDGGPQ